MLGDLVLLSLSPELVTLDGWDGDGVPVPVDVHIDDAEDNTPLFDGVIETLILGVIVLLPL